MVQDTGNSRRATRLGNFLLVVVLSLVSVGRIVFQMSKTSTITSSYPSRIIANQSNREQQQHQPPLPIRPSLPLQPPNKKQQRQRTWSFGANVTTILAENILWSQNWKRYAMASCPSTPVQYFSGGTESRHSAEELASWLRDCHGVIWIRLGSSGNSNVDRFGAHVVHFTTKPFLLVTTDGDNSVPSSIPSYQPILDSPNCLAWYTQNYDGSLTHPKLRPIPIGFDLHTHWQGLWTEPNHYYDNIRQMIQLRRQGVVATTMENRTPTVLVPSWSEDRHPDRKASHGVLDQCNISHVSLTHMPIDQLWNTYTQYQFGLSPFGNGMDCHRTWEYLFFGLVPIVKSSSLDALYQGLPVVIVKEYADLCQDPDYLQRAWKNIANLWPPPDHAFTMRWWLQKGVDPEKDGLLYDIVSSLPL